MSSSLQTKFVLCHVEFPKLSKAKWIEVLIWYRYSRQYAGWSRAHSREFACYLIGNWEFLNG